MLDKENETLGLAERGKELRTMHKGNREYRSEKYKKAEIDPQPTTVER